MCGIAGVSLKNNQEAKKGHLAPLAAALAHRGPDGEGFWHFGSLGLAHRRLSIIDVNGGAQPLLTQGFAAVVNGEIYNYKPLQTELVAKGAKLTTQSDSEVVLHLAAQHGLKAMPELLRGMYALAVADEATQTLLLATDPFGIKPLYYCQNAVGFAFASEPQALAQAGWVRAQANMAVLPALLNRHYSVGHETLWQGIYRLLPGERLLVQNGEIVERWRQLPALKPVQAHTDAAEFPAHLQAAVARHLQADVPFGLLLSGGLDSSALAVMMHKLGAPLFAYTAKIEVKGAAPYEAEMAATLCKKLGATHTIVPYTSTDFWPGLATLAGAMDDLTTDPASLPLLKLTARARTDVKILLSGEGGDETLGGYNHYRTTSNGFRRWLRALKSHRQGDAAPYAKLFKLPMVTPKARTAPWPENGFSALQRKQSADLCAWLPHDLLLKLDRTTMINGIEGRVPYLDDTLAAYSFALPDAVKLNAEFGKLPLRQFLAAQGFDELAYARKQGFSVGAGAFLSEKPELLRGLWQQSALLQNLLKPAATDYLLTRLAHPKIGNLAFSLTLLALWELIHLQGQSVPELQERLSRDAGSVSQKSRRVLMALAGPYVATLALAWLMVLLVLGTLAQTEMGLFQAQQTYFYSFVLWLGFVPTPGGASTMGLLGLGLTLKLILHPWRMKQLGSLLAHIAVWLLLVGGFITALTSTEGYVQIAEGQNTRMMQSYHTPELAVLDASGTTLLKYPVEALKPGAQLPVGEEVLYVEAYYPNSELTMRPEALDDGLTRGARRFMEFTNKAPEADDERNRPTLLFTLLNSTSIPIAKLVLFQHQPVPQPVRVAGHASATLVLRPLQTELPFRIALQRFEAEYYPGTTIARHYASAVEIESAASGTWPAYIRMNVPLRYGGYTLYQASFISAETVAQADTTILAVVKNQGFLIPYVAGILLCIGLLIHLLLRWRRTLPLVLVLPLLMPLMGHATPQNAAFNMATFGRLPIQHEGRLKPMKSYAEVTLHALSGQRNLPELNATQWLAETIYIPENAMQRPFFLVPSLALLERLKLPPRSPRHYSYAELVPALQPQFLALQSIAAQPVAARDSLDTQLLQLATQIQQFYALSQSGKTTADTLPNPLTVHPPRLAEDLWLSPVAAPATAYRATWEAMALAYQQGDAALWNTATQAAWRQAQALPSVRPLALRTEVWLRAAHPFELATCLFVLALMSAFWRRTQKLTGTLLCLGLGVSSVAIAARVYILQRPPVGTLYESVVFVGVICVLGALVAAWQKTENQKRWLIIGAGTGVFVQLLGLRYADSGGDTLGVLTAVLDTNFWLATHVLVITTGYGLALLTGAWAHGMLIVRAWRRQNFAPTELRTLNLLLLAALVFTATGTLLGGVWADQSWGRFWGWDPKENGALLLTLWLIWLLHARLAGVFKPLGLVAGTALTPCVVALAWFGVNLLGVGLHSYGFTQGTMLWLIGFISLEILLISVLVWRIKL